MNRINELFLEALKASLKNERITWSFEITRQQWQQLFQLAVIHHVLPMIESAVHDCPAIRNADSEMLLLCRRAAARCAVMQTVKTKEFLELLRFLYQSGLHPLVVKGLICRELYPYPDYRDSGDEDLIVPADEFDACQRALKSCGLQTAVRKENAITDIAYAKPGHLIYIELHPFPFPPESDVYGSWNDFFKAIHLNTAEMMISGQAVLTMQPTDHLFYLICHGLKHFLHSGFGIRQVCDIVLYANYYGKLIDWQQIFDRCRTLQAHYFAAAIFKIGKKYLIFDVEKAGYPRVWQQMTIDEVPLLEDLLAGGIYGDAIAGRRHSSYMTLDAMQHQKQGIRYNHFSGWIQTAFPSAGNLGNRYPWVRSKPWLLPAAWCHRWYRYLLTQNISAQLSDGLSASKIGEHRIALMQYYQLTDKKQKKRSVLPIGHIKDAYKENQRGDFFGNHQ